MKFVPMMVEAYGDFRHAVGAEVTEGDRVYTRYLSLNEAEDLCRRVNAPEIEDDDASEILTHVRQATRAAPEIETDDQTSDVSLLRFKTADGSVCSKCRNRGAVYLGQGSSGPCDCPVGDLSKFTIFDNTGKKLRINVSGKVIKEAGGMVAYLATVTE